MTAPTVAVVGLRALNADIRRASADTGALTEAMKAAGRAAAEPVAAATRGDLPHVSDRLMGNVRVNAARTGAGVRMGSAKIRYAGWVEFGGTRHPQGPSDRAARPFTPRGRYLFPAAEGLADRSARLYSAALQQALDDYGWTNRTVDGPAVHD